MTVYDVTVLDWTGRLTYHGRHDLHRRTVTITPNLSTAVVCVATPAGQIVALAALAHLRHPSQRPPAIHLKLEHTQ